MKPRFNIGDAIKIRKYKGLVRNYVHDNAIGAEGIIYETCFDPYPDNKVKGYYYAIKYVAQLPSRKKEYRHIYVWEEELSIIRSSSGLKLKVKI